MTNQTSKPMRIRIIASLALAFLAAISVNAAQDKMTGINVVLNTAPTASVLASLGQHGKVRDVVVEIAAVTLQARESELAAIQALPFVAAAGFDQERNASPMAGPAASPLATGVSTINTAPITIEIEMCSPPKLVSSNTSPRMPAASSALSRRRSFIWTGSKTRN
jgi:hypothetical protein